MTRTRIKRDTQAVQADRFFTKNKTWLMTGIFLFSVLLYANTLGHGFVLDDNMMITKNSSVKQGISGLGEIFSHSGLYGFVPSDRNTYRPLTLASFAVEYSMFGTSPFGYHLINILCYGLLTALILVLLFRLFPGAHFLVPLWMALLYASHPIHTEVVANIKSRDEIYAMLFSVAALLAYIRHDRTGSRSWLVSSILLFFLGMLSKEHAVSFAAVFPLYLYFFRQESLLTSVKKTLIFLIPLLLYFLLRFLVLGHPLAPADDSLPLAVNNTLFAAGTPAERWATNFSIFLSYLRLSIFPFPLAYDYSLGTFEIVGFSSPRALAGLLLMLALAGGSIAGWGKRQKYAFAILFFLVTLALPSNFITPISATLGERFLFMPSLGMMMLLVIGIRYAAGFIGIPAGRVILAICLPITMFYAFWTFTRNADWKSNRILFESGHRVHPDAYRINISLGNVYNLQAIAANDQDMKRSLAEKAIFHGKKAVDRFSDGPDAQYGIGVSYQLAGKCDSAIVHYRKALELGSHERIEILENLGQCHYLLDECPDAIVAYEEVLGEDGSKTGVWAEIGYCYFQINELEKASQAFTRCWELSGESNVDCLVKLGVCRHRLGDLDRARQLYEKALSLDPSSGADRYLRQLGN